MTFDFADERAWEIADAMRALVTERVRAGASGIDGEAMHAAVLDALTVVGSEPTDVASAISHLATLVFHAIAYGVIASSADASEISTRLQQQYLIWPDRYGSVLT